MCNINSFLYEIQNTFIRFADIFWNDVDVYD